MSNKWGHRALWLVTLGILVYLFATIPIAKVWDSLTGAPPWTIPVLVVGALVFYASLYLAAIDVRVPPLQLPLFLPGTFLVAALPLPGQELGSAQLITVTVFSPFFPGSPDEREAAVLAASLAGQCIALAVTMSVGIAYLRSQLGHALVTTEAQHEL